MRSRRHASWARVSSRAASTSGSGTATRANDPASSNRASSSASLRSVLTDPRGRAASCPARSPPCSRQLRPPPDKAQTPSSPPHKPGPGRTDSAARRPTRRPRARTAPASARRSSCRSPPRASNGHGHRALPTSSFQPWPDLLTDLGSAGAFSPARQTPARSVRPSTPAVNQTGRPAIGSRHEVKPWNHYGFLTGGRVGLPCRSRRA